MIRYDLICDAGHDFDAWFSGSADFDSQRQRGFLSCPVCGSAHVSKTLMAPSVTTGRQKEAIQSLVTGEAQKQVMAKLRETVATIRANAEDVGARFPEEARKIHYGEAEQRGIIGEAKPDEALALLEEGIEIAALPVLPDETN